MVIMSGRESQLARLGCDHANKVEDIRDLLVRVLSYLPINSVLCSKVVCKLRYQLIKEPQFAQLQFIYYPKAPKFILYLSFGSDFELEAPNSLSLMDIEGRCSPYVTLPPNYLNGINSIWSAGQEMLFIINHAYSTLFYSKFLIAEEMTWREIDCHFRIDKCEPTAFLYEGNLFQCKFFTFFLAKQIHTLII